MKVIQSNADRQAENRDFLTQLLEILPGSEANQEAYAQKIFIASMQRHLDNRYSLLRDVHLEGLDVLIPLVLVGPSGVKVIYASGVRGIFRAKEEEWEKMDSGSREYRLAHPNLVMRTQLMGKTVQTFLASHNNAVEDLETVLFFSNPGSHVDSIRPAVRIVPSDALERFGLMLSQSPPYLGPERAHKIIRLLTGEKPAPSLVPEPVERQDAFSFRDVFEEKKPAAKTTAVKKTPVRRQGPSISKKIPFTTRQWAALAILSIITIILLSAFLIFVLLTN